MTTTGTWNPVSNGRPTDHTKKYLVFSNWGIRMAHLHPPQWANGEFQDAESDNDEGMYDWDSDKGPFTVTHWMELPEPPEEP